MTSREIVRRAIEFDPGADPAQRLAATVTQRKARALLAREDEFFLDETVSPDTTQTEE